MDKDKIIEQVQQLKQALEDIEKRLGESEVPLAVLEDFKMAVDHTRMTVWAILSTAQTDLYEVAASIVRFRLKRMAEMCRQTISDIDTNEITVDSAELAAFFTALKEAHERINRLYKSGL